MANEKRLIDANALMEAHIEGVNKGEILLYYSAIRFLIENAPTVDAVEVVHGRWIERHNEKLDVWSYECSACGIGYVLGMRDVRTPPYCQECGAKMDGGNEDGNL